MDIAVQVSGVMRSMYRKAHYTASSRKLIELSDDAVFRILRHWGVKYEIRKEIYGCKSFGQTV